MAVDLSDVYVDGIAQTLESGRRSPAWLKDVARRWHCAESIVREIAEALDRRAAPIFESAPAGSPPKGHTMTTSSTLADAVGRFYREHGTGPHIDSLAASAFGITEAQAHAAGEGVRKVITETGDSLPDTSASTGPDAPARLVSAAQDAQRLAQAQDIADRANAAEARAPSTWNHRDLEALAALNF